MTRAWPLVLLLLASPAYADEPPPASSHLGTLGPVIAIALAAAAIAGGVWLAKRRGGKR